MEVSKQSIIGIIVTSTWHTTASSVEDLLSSCTLVALSLELRQGQLAQFSVPEEVQVPIVREVGRQSEATMGRKLSVKVHMDRERQIGLLHEHCPPKPF